MGLPSIFCEMSFLGWDTLYSFRLNYCEYHNLRKHGGEPHSYRSMRNQPTVVNQRSPAAACGMNQRSPTVACVINHRSSTNGPYVSVESGTSEPKLLIYTAAHILYSSVKPEIPWKNVKPEIRAVWPKTLRIALQLSTKNIILWPSTSARS